jgi:hypothetical protein
MLSITENLKYEVNDKLLKKFYYKIYKNQVTKNKI